MEKILKHLQDEILRTQDRMVKGLTERSSGNVEYFNKTYPSLRHTIDWSPLRLRYEYIDTSNKLGGRDGDYFKITPFGDGSYMIFSSKRDLEATKRYITMQLNKAEYGDFAPLFTLKNKSN